jgi:hypothetical protein
LEIIKYSDLVRRIVSYCQRVYEELSGDDSDAIKTYLDSRLKQIWEFYAWPDLIKTEKRYYRALYSATANYVAGNEVYYPTEKKYYQALKATNGNVPTLTTHWAESKQSYAADPWVAGAAYVVGDIVEYASDGLFYACHTAHTSSGTLLPTATGNNNRWGKLTALDKYVAWEQAGESKIGDVLSVWDDDPRANKKAEKENFSQSQNGIQVIDGPNIVYIQYRQIVPNIFYHTWVASNSYKIGDVVRYPATGADFDLYEAKTDHTSSSSNDPSDGTADWGIINIPRDFQKYLTHSAAADLLFSDEREALGGAQHGMAEKALIALVDKFERQEGQSNQVEVKIDGSY